MWEMWTNRKAFADKINTVKSIKTLGDFVKFVTRSGNRLELDIEDGIGILHVNLWNECIMACQAGDLKADEWRDRMTNNKYKYAQCPIVKQSSRKDDQH